MFNKNETVYTPILKKLRRKEMLSLVIWHPADQKTTRNIKDLSEDWKVYNLLRPIFWELRKNLLRNRVYKKVK